ncbi:MAG: sensor histidine kinase [Solirubrobacteraceae bacterium]
MIFIRRHARAWDAALALLLAALVLEEVLVSDQDVPLGLAVPVALAMTVPLAWRRRAPVPVAAVVLAAFMVQGVAGDWRLEPQSELLAVALAFWAVGAHAPDPTSWRAAVAGLLAVVIQEPGDAIVMGPLMAGVFAAGRLMRSRSELAAALERDRAEGERQAVAEERARIARELHDVVAHSISLMTVQAGAERLALGRERPVTAEALTQIEVTGRQALAEMRRLLGMLRGPGEEVDLAPQPGLGQLSALAERVTRAGLPVELTVEGEPAPVSPGVDISAYRIAQEGLTNALKHAHARRAEVRIAHRDDQIEIEVTDDGQGGAPAVNGAGHGLSGMRERVALYGGTLDAGPRPEGGWSLRARLPREPTP